MFRERGLPWLLWLLLLEQGRGIVGGRGHCPTPQGAGEVPLVIFPGNIIVQVCN